MFRIIACVLACFLGGWVSMQAANSAGSQDKKDKALRLGNFSVSLTVKDLAASRAFYEKLGLHQVAGDAKSWLILQNDSSTIGLFQGPAVKKNTLTYNPGWDREMKAPASWDDVRDIQKELKARGLALTLETDANATGPASIMLTDPDGNPVLIDQHVPRP